MYQKERSNTQWTLLSNWTGLQKVTHNHWPTHSTSQLDSMGLEAADQQEAVCLPACFRTSSVDIHRASSCRHLSQHAVSRTVWDRCSPSGRPLCSTFASVSAGHRHAAHPSHHVQHYAANKTIGTAPGESLSKRPFSTFWKPTRCNCLMILVLYICFGE